MRHTAQSSLKKRLAETASDALGEREIYVRSRSGRSTFIRLRPRAQLALWGMAVALATWSVFAFLHVVAAPEATREGEARLLRAQDVWEERAARASADNAALRARIEASRARFSEATRELEDRQTSLESLMRRQANAATRLEALRRAEADRVNKANIHKRGTGGPAHEPAANGGAGGPTPGDKVGSVTRLSPMLVKPGRTLSRPPKHRIANDVSARPLDSLLDPDFASTLAQILPSEANVPDRLRAIDRRQRRILSRIEEQTHHALTQLESVARDAQITRPERLAAKARSNAGGIGGAFHAISADTDTTAFGLQLRRVKSMLVRLETLDIALSISPLALPMDDIVLTSPYGVRVDPFLNRIAFHEGLDLTTIAHGDILAPLAGTVSRVDTLPDYGILVEINHGYGVITRYGHLKEARVAAGDSVPFRGIIGVMGSTGRSTGPHLHYEIRINGEPVDPAPYIAGGRVAFHTVDARP